jgi:hypothetical protein
LITHLKTIHFLWPRGVFDKKSITFASDYNDHKTNQDMNDTTKKMLENDSNGLLTYEYIANNMGNIDEDLPTLVDNMIMKDRTGQFVVSTARYLNAIDRDKYATSIDLLVKAAIAKDRDHVYLAYLASSLWGTDYKEHAAELSANDDNFRRIYKRLYPVGI